jgi:glucose-1-phosphate thymidylyltransferase
MKGIILAGGKGTRLYPSTFTVSKQLLPVYDKPMIYYPLSVLMLAGIQEILIISTPEHLPQFEAMFGSGEQLGLSFQYQVQEEPKGLAQAFILGEEFIGQDDVCLILGDNIFYGHGLTELVKEKTQNLEGGLIFGYEVEDPTCFGVAELDEAGRVLAVEEKPANPKSNYAIPGLYYFDHHCVEYAKNAEPSERGEIEITSVMEQYIATNSLRLEPLGRGTAWLDSGTHESLLEAAQFVHTIEKRQGMKIACLEEIAYHNGFIDFEGLVEAAKRTAKSEYGQYLKKLVDSIKNKKVAS